MITHHPDDGGSKNLWNVEKLLPDYTQQPRRQPSSYSPLFEPKKEKTIASTAFSADTKHQI
jgi:hypothetical protein